MKKHSPPKPPSPRAKKPRVDPRVTFFIAQGGPKRGEPEYAVTFTSQAEALAFLANQHGLTREEAAELRRQSRLSLDRAWHGAEKCEIKTLKKPAEELRELLNPPEPARAARRTIQRERNRAPRKEG